MDRQQLSVPRYRVSPYKWRRTLWRVLLYWRPTQLDNAGSSRTWECPVRIGWFLLRPGRTTERWTSDHRGRRPIRRRAGGHDQLPVLEQPFWAEPWRRWP